MSRRIDELKDLHTLLQATYLFLDTAECPDHYTEEHLTAAREHVSDAKQHVAALIDEVIARPWDEEPS